jgi:hypothetical protein
MAVSWVVAPCKLTDVAEVLTASIIRVMKAMSMEAVGTSEALLNLYQCIRRYSPKDSRIRTYRRDNLVIDYKDGCTLGCCAG